MNSLTSSCANRFCLVRGFSPLSIPDLPVTHAPGSILHLGPLDIFWRSGFDEPGRLITSTLSCRIPLPPAAPAPTARSIAPHPPASAVPPYLQGKASVSGGGLTRSGSPQLPIGAQPATPPLGPVPARTGSPFRNRPASVAPSAWPQSPSLVGANVLGIPALAPPPPPPPDFDVDLVVCTRPPNPTPVEEPVTLGFMLSASAPSPPRSSTAS
ncbi:hypothetical protein PUNSTDRAFT_146527 [Punctularia strigosozonata HHB-11173 SS5]|uniref:Uncharacterized protein n=1 Tax=Punctularia strigosozonata (strain HHB-11173) TaxID=741275 RepID=R7S261_PUNST|nr:uncharacterized protein PUNSTDRAFT_146527 [Punctularia strigosozonata HHB-11173 SS5]EIN04278.1 hypothetical protein PUNSTDRAFT_146527 [Punctularia strigosozonata HHB-11173 SS5]